PTHGEGVAFGDDEQVPVGECADAGHDDEVLALQEHVVGAGVGQAEVVEEVGVITAFHLAAEGTDLAQDGLVHGVLRFRTGWARWWERPRRWPGRWFGR